MHRVWKEAGLKPPSPGALASDEREFEQRFEPKRPTSIGLYRPACRRVLRVDEKTAILALDRLDPVLPLSPGRAERHRLRVLPDGTLSLYAALDTQTGCVHGRTTARHTVRTPTSWPPRPRRSAIVVVLALAAEASYHPRQPRAHKTHPTEFETSFNSIRACSCTSPSTYSLLAQPSGDLVRQDRTRGHRPRHFTSRSSGLASQTPSLHQCLLRQRSPDPVEIL